MSARAASVSERRCAQDGRAGDLAPERGRVARPGPGRARLGAGAMLGRVAHRGEPRRQGGTPRRGWERRPELVACGEEPGPQAERDGEAGGPPSGRQRSGPAGISPVHGGARSSAAASAVQRRAAPPSSGLGRVGRSASERASSRSLGGELASEIGVLASEDGAQHRGGSGGRRQRGRARVRDGAQGVVLRAAHERVQPAVVVAVVKGGVRGVAAPGGEVAPRQVPPDQLSRDHVPPEDRAGLPEHRIWRDRILGPCGAPGGEREGGRREGTAHQPSTGWRYGSVGWSSRIFWMVRSRSANSSGVRS